MPRVDLVVKSQVKITPRLMQACSMFEVPVSGESSESWAFNLDLPEDWSIGLVTGPSGAGKSTLMRALFPDTAIADEFDWPSDRAVIDAFPAATSIKDVAALLSSVGFSSPPEWLRPYHVLSMGQKFRVHVARALAEKTDLIVVDEFTSVVDRTVAQIGSAAIARTVRARKQKFVAVTCHNDVIDWLQPDWVLEMPQGFLTRRSVRRRPEISLEIARVDSKAWDLFRHHHYLDHELNKAAACFVASWDSVSVAFASVLAFPHPIAPSWREHRTVCLPDYQGVGIGNALSAYVASLYAATGKPYRSVTAHPSMIAHRNKSKLWALERLPSRVGPASKTTGRSSLVPSTNRNTASFLYIGSKNPEDAARFGLGGVKK